MDPNHIVEAFRQAAIGMTSWTHALHLLSQATHARIGQLAVANDVGGLALNLLAGASEDETAAYLAAGGPDPALNPRTRAVMRAAVGQTIVDAQFIDAAEIDRTPIYRSLFAQCDVPFSLQARLPIRGKLAVLSLHRSRFAGEADRSEQDWLDSLIPAIAGAVDAGLTLGRDRNETLLTVAEGLTGPVLLLGSEMTLIAHSPSVEPLFRDLLTLRDGRIAAIDRLGQSRLNQAFTRASGTPLSGSARTMLRRTNGTAVPIDLVALPEKVSGPLSAARVLLSVQLPRLSDEHQARQDLRDIFGLTPAEAEVALLLAEGYSAEAVAVHRRSSVATVKSQVKMIFGKTGVQRQVDLVIMLRPFRFL
ncbi:helix-turn-helix transcriptional regulator [Sphingomonas populi]|uniref:Helix-turn-helix transcriptional regulator n=1 Tax=Sphingomonas populi TaxID=2484750 RepID=A0A4Q6XWC1_9SPHN|nr:helix-turn-helix transcriptional regulator [Sphingomonas populi]RZF61259.1 helix-turn-helix transcriptional regulator [Sphingomonas populi]